VIHRGKLAPAVRGRKGIYKELFQAARNELLGIQVGGTLKKPVIKVRVLRDTRSAWERLMNPRPEQDEDVNN